MEAIKKTGKILNSTLLLKGLDSLNNRRVEVIIIARDQVKKNKAEKHHTKKKALKNKVAEYSCPFDSALSEKDWEANN